MIGEPTERQADMVVKELFVYGVVEPTLKTQGLTLPW